MIAKFSFFANKGSIVIIFFKKKYLRPNWNF